MPPPFLDISYGSWSLVVRTASQSSLKLYENPALPKPYTDIRIPCRREGNRIVERWKEFSFIVLAAIILISGLVLFRDLLPALKDSEGEGMGSGEEKKILWGVDSASFTTENLYRCTQENFGKPAFWGRYLGDRENISAGLTADEAAFLHSKNISILLIYNHVTDARGFDRGVTHAERAASMARELKVPEGRAIFVDIEPGYPIDSDFVKGWYQGMSAEKYMPAMYGVFAKEKELSAAFEKAVTEEKDINQMLLWTAHPQTGISVKAKAPKYEPEAPSGAKTLGWQYGIDAKECNIDTNLFNRQIENYLW